MILRAISNLTSLLLELELTSCNLHISSFFMFALWPPSGSPCTTMYSLYFVSFSRAVFNYFLKTQNNHDDVIKTTMIIEDYTWQHEQHVQNHHLQWLAKRLLWAILASFNKVLVIYLIKKGINTVVNSLRGKSFSYHNTMFDMASK